MSETKGKLIICDRCGEKCFLALQGEEDLDGGFSRIDLFEDLPAGWSVAAMGNKRLDLCPLCSAAYKKLCDDFIGSNEK